MFFSEKRRGIIKKITVEIEYPNGGVKKSRAYNPQRDNIEGIFWSDRMINEVLAPYYDNQNAKHDTFEVMEMWDPLHNNWDERPTMLLKGINDKIIPACTLHRDADDFEDLLTLDRIFV